MTRNTFEPDEEPEELTEDQIEIAEQKFDDPSWDHDALLDSLRAQQEIEPLVTRHDMIKRLEKKLAQSNPNE